MKWCDTRYYVSHGNKKFGSVAGDDGNLALKWWTHEIYDRPNKNLTQSIWTLFILFDPIQLHMRPVTFYMFRFMSRGIRIVGNLQMRIQNTLSQSTHTTIREWSVWGADYDVDYLRLFIRINLLTVKPFPGQGGKFWDNTNSLVFGWGSLLILCTVRWDMSRILIIQALNSKFAHYPSVMKPAPDIYSSDAYMKRWIVVDPVVDARSFGVSIIIFLSTPE